VTGVEMQSKNIVYKSINFSRNTQIKAGNNFLEWSIIAVFMEMK